MSNLDDEPIIDISDADTFEEIESGLADQGKRELRAFDRDMAEKMEDPNTKCLPQFKSNIT